MCSSYNNILPPNKIPNIIGATQLHRIKTFARITLLPLSLVSTYCSASLNYMDEFNSMGYFQSGDIYPDAPGEVDCTTFPYYLNRGDAGEYALPLGLEFGVTDHWLIGLVTQPFTTINSNDEQYKFGMSDVFLYTQYSMLNIYNSHTSVSLIFNLGLPAGKIDDAMTDGFIRYNPTVVVAHDFVNTVYVLQVFAQAGMSFVQRVQTPRDHTNSAPNAHRLRVNTGIALRSRYINFSTELNWRTSEWNHNGDINSLYRTPGVSYQPADHIEMGIGVPVGLTKKSDNVRILGQLIYVLTPGK